ncbi:MAG: SURF1 family protein [Pseudomonadota bacterium]|nr:SURF1 family protein [Pseudomonadota bacterium]
MAVTFSLGRWQLARAAEKQALQTALAERARLPALDAAALTTYLSSPPPDERLHRRIQLGGHWLAEHTVFLDNRPLHGQSGFIVLTPLRLEGGAGAPDRVVLVQRGWAPRNFAEREALPPVQTPPGAVQISGRLAERVPAAFALGQEGGGHIRQNLDLPGFRSETGLPLAGLVVVQTGEPSDGLRRDWPAPDTGIEKHYGYAFQWFGLCALMGLLFVWFQVVQPLQESSRR